MSNKTKLATNSWLLPLLPPVDRYNTCCDRQELPAPTIITRKLHLISAAMNDAFAAFDPKDPGAYRRLKSKNLNPGDVDEVVASAAYKVACEVLPDHEEMFDNLLAEQGFDKKTKASRKGRKAGRSVLRARKNDGSSDQVDTITVSTVITLMSGNLFVFLLAMWSTSTDLLLSLMILIHTQFRNPSHLSGAMLTPL